MRNQFLPMRTRFGENTSEKNFVSIKNLESYKNIISDKKGI